LFLYTALFRSRASTAAGSRARRVRGDRTRFPPSKQVIHEMAERMDTPGDRAPERDPPAEKLLEGAVAELVRERAFGVRRHHDPKRLEAPPRTVLRVAAQAQELERARRGLGDGHEPLSLEHVLHLITVRLVNTAKHEEDLVARGVLVALQQLGDDLVGAREVEDGHLREVDQRERANARALEARLDGHADRAAGGPGDQMGVQRRDGALEHLADVDGQRVQRQIAHASRAGSTIEIWAPGKGARWSTRGGVSSHGGTWAMRAVPLRTEIAPFQRWT